VPSGAAVEYRKTVLDGGLRIITEKIPGARSVAIGIWIDIGSRDERKEENGICHFVEHMLFKGTRSQSAEKIAASLESLGGSLNAFTSREQTCFHAYILDEHLPQAVDVLADILMNSTISPMNIRREKSVVVEEIREVDETPSDHIHELFSNSFWRGQPLGWPIMGSRENVMALDRRRIKAFIKNHYRAGQVIVAAAGNLNHRRLAAMIERKLNFPSGNANRGEAAAAPVGFSTDFFNNGSDQTHLCLGFPGLSYSDSDKLKLLALHTYLGGGMSSVLFQKIREEKGMAYSLYTFADFYRDSGIFGAYLATDRRHLHDAVEIMLREFRKVKKVRLPRAKFDRIIDQFKGSLVLGMESTSGRMNRLARQEIYTEKYISLREALRSIGRIESDDLLETARRILNPENITITALGSADKDDLKQVDWSLL
jgi:predicted Zn-dependent peptidase